MHTIRIPSVPCARCGHTWVPRSADVTVWARCKRPYWDRPQKARAAAVSPAAACAPPCLSEGDAMAQSSRTTWLVSLLALAAVLVLHVSPAWQPAPRPGMRWEGAAPLVVRPAVPPGVATPPATKDHQADRSEDDKLLRPLVAFPAHQRPSPFTRSHLCPPLARAGGMHGCVSLSGPCGDIAHGKPRGVLS